MAHTCHTYVVWGSNRVSARVLVIRSRPLSCQQECTTFRYPQLAITNILGAGASSMVPYIDVLAQQPAREAESITHSHPHTQTISEHSAGCYMYYSLNP